MHTHCTCMFTQRSRDQWNLLPLPHPLLHYFRLLLRGLPLHRLLSLRSLSTFLFSQLRENKKAAGWRAEKRLKFPFCPRLPTSNCSLKPFLLIYGLLLVTTVFWSSLYTGEKRIWPFAPQPVVHVWFVGAALFYLYTSEVQPVASLNYIMDRTGNRGFETFPLQISVFYFIIIFWNRYTPATFDWSDDFLTVAGFFYS